ncbi:MAG: rhodanese-like domain-containing protein [Ignisphaera sp.]|nr:rhodanese-like domain-containing protein [Ignisphaera sp.]MCX8168309.1 rhodanese-like domain-containing protein [Ignisphaera sp.]MDW8085359.1 rhodanese-like domain-containing protein [Ignisphaera sp.]
MHQVPPIVTTEWLDSNISNQNIVVVDIRPRDDYLRGHIPRAINIPFDPLKSAWSTVRNELLLELPAIEELFQTIGSAGITQDTIVVVVNKVDSPFNRADAVRVAVELIYAGLNNVAVLDGGYNKWIKEGRRISTEIVEPTPKYYNGVARKQIFVEKLYVLERIGESMIIDARDPDVYFGVTTEPWAPIPGHIPTAKNFPAPWMWMQDGVYRPIEEIRKMIEGLIGSERNREVIIYCGVGGYAATVWYIMTQLLGYTNAKIYDGGWQEWVREPQGPISVYRWE